MYRTHTEQVDALREDKHENEAPVYLQVHKQCKVSFLQIVVQQRAVSFGVVRITTCVVTHSHLMERFVF